MNNHLDLDALDLLRRIAIATEQTAQWTFVIAFPIWIGVALSVVAFIAWMAR
jgi:hypothetical protein